MSSIEVEVPVSRSATQRGRVAPTLSIAVATRRDRAQLHALLAQLAPQCARADARLVVARPYPASESTAIAKVFPAVQFLSAPVDASDAQLRTLAMAQAPDDVVAFVDDAGPTPRGWVEMLRRRLSADVATGLAAGEHGSGEGEREEVLAPFPAPAGPGLSVIVPVHQGASVLPRALSAVAASDLPRSEWELIVVDDASTDGSALTAAPFADVVVRIPGKPFGPAYARNRGFQVARGDILVFVDADVCVHREALSRFAAAFAEDAQLSAVSGSYDDRPPGRGLVSRYRNLLQHFYHQEAAGPVDRFWASCGAVRSSVFAESGMYDEWRFRRPQIEDVELGRRIRALGHSAVLRPDIQCTHLKEWTLAGMLGTTLHDRGVPWMRLDPDESGRSERPRRSVQTSNTLFTWLAIASAALALYFRQPAYLLAGAVALAPVLYRNRRQYVFFARRCGSPFAVAVVPLDLMNYAVNGVGLLVGWVLRQVVGEPKPDPAVQAFAEVGMKTWPPVPMRSIDRTAARPRSLV